MQKKLGPPREIILLAGVGAHSALELVDRRERISEFLVEFASQTIQISAVPARAQMLHVFAGAGNLARAFQRQGEIVFIIEIVRVDFVCGFERRNGLVEFLCMKVELT